VNHPFWFDLTGWSLLVPLTPRLVYEVCSAPNFCYFGSSSFAVHCSFWDVPQNFCFGLLRFKYFSFRKKLLRSVVGASPRLDKALISCFLLLLFLHRPPQFWSDWFPPREGPSNFSSWLESLTSLPVERSLLFLPCFSFLFRLRRSSAYFAFFPSQVLTPPDPSYSTSCNFPSLFVSLFTRLRRLPSPFHHLGNSDAGSPRLNYLSSRALNVSPTPCFAPLLILCSSSYFPGWQRLLLRQA